MKDILLFVSGTTPQIVTETLWALVRTGRISRVDGVHIITTLEGERVARERLVAEAILSRLCDEIQISPIPSLKFHLITDGSGAALEDIRNTSDNTNLANSIMTIVRDLTADPEIRLHASLSGGRKTMSFFMGYAMSMYGRPQDILYHVMVSGSFESAPDFFYKPNIPIEIVHRGKILSTDDADIDVAEIPFLRLRDWVDEPILRAPRVDFGAITKRVQAALSPQTVTFHDDDCRIVIGDISFVMRPQLYAMYRIFAEVRAARLPGAGPDGVGPEHCGWLTATDFASKNDRGAKRYLSLTEELLRTSEAKHTYAKGVISSASDGTKKGRRALADHFNPIFSRVREVLTENIIDPALRQQFWLYTRDRNPARRGLLIEPHRIKLDGN